MLGKRLDPSVPPSSLRYQGRKNGKSIRLSQEDFSEQIPEVCSALSLSGLGREFGLRAEDYESDTNRFTLYPGRETDVCGHPAHRQCRPGKCSTRRPGSDLDRAFRIQQ